MRQTHKTHGGSWEEVGGVSRRTPAHLEGGCYIQVKLDFFLWGCIFRMFFFVGDF